MTNEVSPLNAYLPSTIKKLYSCKLNTLYFITIKDNSQSTRWTQLGKVRDWLHRSCKSYIIVKGTNGGIHFHALCSKIPDKKFRFQKGIHFHVKSLADIETSISTGNEHYLDRQLRIDNAAYIKHDTFDYISNELEQQSKDIIYSITQMIQKYWLRKRTNEASRQRRIKKKTKVMFVVDCCVRYLQKNLDEPREHALRKYSDYMAF